MSYSEAMDVKVVWRRGEEVKVYEELVDCGYRTEVSGERRARQIGRRHWKRREYHYFNSGGSFMDITSLKKSTDAKEAFIKRDAW